MSSAFDVQMAALEKSVGMPKLSIRDPLILVPQIQFPAACTRKARNSSTSLQSHINIFVQNFDFPHDWENQYDNQVGRGVPSSFAKC